MSLRDWLIKKVVMDWLKKQKETPMFKLLEGKKTYITMAIIAILGALDAYNGHCVATSLCKAFAVPGWIFSILAALGVYTRAIAKK